MDGLDFSFAESTGEFALRGVFVEKGAVEDAGGKIGTFSGGVTAVAAIEFAPQLVIGFADQRPGVTDAGEFGPTFLGGAGVALAQGFLHFFVSGKALLVHLVAIASSPGLVKNGLGAGLLDELVECDRGLVESLGKDRGKLALILKHHEVELAVLDLVGGRFAFEMELEGFSSRIDEGELGVGVGRFLDELGDRSFDPAGVAVADEEDLLGSGSRGEKGEEEKEKDVAGGHRWVKAAMGKQNVGFGVRNKPGLSFWVERRIPTETWQWRLLSWF